MDDSSIKMTSMKCLRWERACAVVEQESSRCQTRGRELAVPLIRSNFFRLLARTGKLFSEGGKGLSTASTSEAADVIAANNRQARHSG